MAEKTELKEIIYESVQCTNCKSWWKTNIRETSKSDTQMLELIDCPLCGCDDE